MARNLVLLESGNGPFLDVGRYIVGLFDSKREAVRHAKKGGLAHFATQSVKYYPTKRKAKRGRA